MIKQIEIELKPYKRGFHLITNEILNKIGALPEKGLLNIFIKHTSAGITINENADPTVLHDFEVAFNHLIKENEPYYQHTFEGSDDMPAHIKSSLVGSSITIPITNYQLNLGTWQGIYLCEFRNNGGSRKLTATIYY
ncbi:MAG: secondary thiamine-phosphate synthase enzyme YjbQ [Vicingaceae bacterium]